MITKMQPQSNVAVPQSVTTQPSQQIVGVSANAVILKMSDIQQISTVGKCRLHFYSITFKLIEQCGRLSVVEILCISWVAHSMNRVMRYFRLQVSN